MKPTILLGTAPAIGDRKELKLYQHDADFYIHAGTEMLMNSRMHGSEAALAELACAEVIHTAKPRILIGGLGMGFTLRTALNLLPPSASVVVAELVPEVVKWNQGVLGPLAEHPLLDPRVTIYGGDVGKKIKKDHNEYNAILLDVDNGPQRLFRESNNEIYAGKGLRAAYQALRVNGILAIWSAGPDARFTQRLQQAGFAVKETRVHARSGPKAGGYHLIWLAKKMRV